jgi:hypothetical protein
MNTNNNDHSTVHVQPISERKEHGQHQKSPLHEGPNFRVSAFSLWHLPKPLSDFATLTTDVFTDPRCNRTKIKGAAMNTRNFRELGDVCLDILTIKPQAPATKRLPPTYLFVAVDHASRWAYGELHQSRSALFVDFLENLARKAPFRIHTVFTTYDRPFHELFVNGRATINDVNETFNQACVRLGIVHRSTPPWRPVDAGVLERFHRSIGEGLKTAGGISPKDFAPTLLRYLEQYNEHLPQLVLGHITPIQAVRRGIASATNVGDNNPLSIKR